MPEADAPITREQKLKALRQIQFALGQVEQPIARACGLSEEIFVALANGELIEVTFDADDGTILDRYHIDKILSKGDLILAQAALVKPHPLQVSIVTPPKSVLRRISEAMGNKLLAAITNALSAAVGAVVGWYLKKHFP
ncbi:MAG: hypothetical protein ABSG87_06730 [Verrucomicrobiota bacterium]|jgi:hypothetical protein